MKQCSYCGKEYPDDAVACDVDGQALQDPVPTSGGMPPRSIVAIALFGVLSTFSGVGVAWMAIATIANHMNSKPYPGHPVWSRPGDAFVAHSIPILIGGGLVGFIVGLVGKYVSVKRKLNAQQSAATNGDPVAKPGN